MKTILNYFSQPIKKLRDSEGSSVLVYPQFFSETTDEIGEQTVFDITKRDTEGSPVEFWTRNLVGFISYNNQEVTISSRFSSKENDNFLYYILSKVAGINLLSFDFSTQNKDKGLNLMLFLFPKLLKEALAQGLFKQYIYREYNDANVRGPIDINRHIRRNIPFNGRVAYRTREFSYDNPLTQLVRHAIEWIKKNPWGGAILNNDETTKSFVQTIVEATPTYEARRRQEIINENLRPATHPYFTAWQPLQEFCLKLLRYESLSYGTANDNKIHGLLIDAAWLWEEYVAKVLSEKGLGMKHYTRKNSPFHLFEPLKGRPFQPIIPDYYDENNNIVADAKYIPLNRYDRLDADRAAPIYYKTIMYMYRFDSKNGFLFHPVSPDEVNGLNVTSDTYQIEERPDCHLYEIGMVIPDTPSKTENDKYLNFSDFCGIMKEREDIFVEEIKKNTSPL